MSYLEPLPPSIAFERVKPGRFNFLVVTCIILVLLSIVAGLIAYAVLRNRSAVNITRCEPGLCVVNTNTGVKRCPSSDTERLTYSSLSEDCTSSNYCQSQKVPCAVLAGGTLNCGGNCGVGNNTCNCQKAPT